MASHLRHRPLLLGPIEIQVSALIFPPIYLRISVTIIGYEINFIAPVVFWGAGEVGGLTSDSSCCVIFGCVVLQSFP